MSLSYSLSYTIVFFLLSIGRCEIELSSDLFAKYELEEAPQPRLGCEPFALNHTECGCFIDYPVVVGLFLDGTQQVRGGKLGTMIDE
jgi:hypothetical protein